MKHNYEKPVMDILDFFPTDIVCASIGMENGDALRPGGEGKTEWNL